MKDIIKKVFGTDDPAEVAAKKESEKQSRAFLTSKKPSKVAMDEDECKKLCSKIGLEYLPGYEGRVLAYEITNESVDRYGDIVRVAGIDVSNYMKNPVIMWSHRHSDTPIGNSLKVDLVKKEKRAESWGLFLDDRVDTSGLSELIFKLAKSGAMPACSIGFMPKKTYRPKDDSERTKLGLGLYGVEFQESDLLEWSPCAIPANPTALQVNSVIDSAKSCGLVSSDLQLMEKTGLLSSADMRKVFEKVFPGVEINTAAGDADTGDTGGEAAASGDTEGAKLITTDDLDSFFSAKFDAINEKIDGIFKQYNEQIETHIEKIDKLEASINSLSLYEPSGEGEDEGDSIIKVFKNVFDGD